MPNIVESFSGIRGVYGDQINEKLAFKYAVNFCKLFNKNKDILVIGRDTRESGPVLTEAILKGFQTCGVKKVIDVGILPVQACQLSIIKFKAFGGVYISASHNEPEYNGWKFLKSDGALLYPSQANRLIDEVHCDSSGYQDVDLSVEKIDRNLEAVDSYIDFVIGRIKKENLEKIKESEIKILVDPNGGSGIAVLGQLFEKLGVQVEIINDKFGGFARLVEPNAESLKYLNKKVDEGGFDFACGFDCDADRVELVIPSDNSFSKEMGQMVSGQYVLALACDNYLAGTKNEVVVTNDCISYLLRDVISKYRAIVKEVEVGEMVVVEEMEKQKSIIGGEGSCGGVIVPPIKCRDGIMAVLLILEIIAKKGKSLCDILLEYPKYYSERIKIDCSPGKSIEIKKELETVLKKQGYLIKKTGGVDGGLKAIVDNNSYIWFRQSKTEPGSFRIITDGDDANKVKLLLQKGLDIFNKLK